MKKYTDGINSIDLCPLIQTMHYGIFFYSMNKTYDVNTVGVNPLTDTIKKVTLLPPEESNTKN